MVDDGDKIGPFDAERGTYSRLAEPGIAVNDGQNRKLAGPRHGPFLTRNEVGENRQLGLPQHIADLFVETCEVGRRRAWNSVHGGPFVHQLLYSITLEIRIAPNPL